MEFTAKIQEQGRITIPFEVREVLKLKEKDFVKIELDRVGTHGTKV